MAESLIERMRPYQHYMYKILYPRIEKLLEEEKEKQYNKL